MVDELMPQSSPSYFSVIPGNVRRSKNLLPQEKLLYGDIASLCNLKGFCWASNEYLAEIAGLSERHITRMLSNLEKEGHILIRRKNGTDLRQIFISSEVYHSIPGFDSTNLSKHDKELDRISLDETPIQNDCGSDSEGDLGHGCPHPKTPVSPTSDMGVRGSEDDFSVDTRQNAPKTEPILKDYNINNNINRKQANKEENKTAKIPKTPLENYLESKLSIPLLEFYELVDTVTEIRLKYYEKDLRTEATKEELEIVDGLSVHTKSLKLGDYITSLVNDGMFLSAADGDRSSQVMLITTFIFDPLPENTRIMFEAFVSSRSYNF